METFYIDRYQIDINVTPETKAGDKVVGYIKMRYVDGCPEAEKEKSHFVFGYSVYKLMDDTAADLAKRIFVHYKMGTEPETKRPVEESMSASQIRGSIQVNEQAWDQASKTLRELLDEPRPRRAYYNERLISQLNLCSEIAGDRARLEFELQKAIQSGR
jgi:hypothetical protein